MSDIQAVVLPRQAVRRKLFELSLGDITKQFSNVLRKNRRKIARAIAKKAWEAHRNVPQT